MSSYQRPVKLTDIGTKKATKTEKTAETRKVANSEKVSPKKSSKQIEEFVNQKVQENSKQKNTITKIEAQKRRKNRFSLYIDDEFVAGISERTLTKLMLVKGQVLTDEEIKRVKQTEERSQLIETALNYLAAMPRTVKEVRDKLKDVTDEADAIDEIIEYLTSLNYLDDASYAKHYMNDAIHLKQKSPKRVQYELRKKGVSDRIIEATLVGYAEDDAVQNARALAEKKYQQYLRKTSQYSSLQKTYAFLAQKGFSGDVINEALEPLKEEAVDETQEMANLRRDRDKYYRRYQKYDDGVYRTKQQLIKKGYLRELINDVMDELEDSYDG